VEGDERELKEQGDKEEEARRTSKYWIDALRTGHGGAGKGCRGRG
jgi:hypothetical protein